MEAISVDSTINRVLRATARMYWPENDIDRLGNDTEAECRWWNGLPLEERTAFTMGAHLAGHIAALEWLDIAENHRGQILGAARAVQCWLAGGAPALAP